MNVTAFFHSFPPEIATVLIAMLPIGELRVSIPVALTVYHLPLISAFVYSLIGNVIPIIFLLWLLGPFSGYVMQRFLVARRFFEWLFERTRHKFAGQYAIWGAIALVVFVAIPLPGTGAWTGAMAAFLFGIPKKQAFLLVTLGTVLAGVIVTMVTLGTMAVL